MKARMKDNLIMRYQLCSEFDYRWLNTGIANELQYVRVNEGHLEYMKLKLFLKGIEGRVVDLVFTSGDAFEAQDNNFFLPSALWDVCDG